MSDYDEFDDIFRNMRRFVERRSPDGAIDDEAFADLPQLEDVGASLDSELIVGDKAVTFLLFAKAGSLEDFLVIADDRELEVKTQYYSVKKRLRFRVDSKRPCTTYKNGVLSVRLMRLK